ncbi:GNAT family N-acetyltransferase [Streptomyces sp. NPDC127051]|uniref:GNAT family N-acetyltransferase n=1 Tax=Streptomyces sp. NPDC127051 TaxID=3347119 RepID=UPI00364F1016
MPHPVPLIGRLAALEALTPEHASDLFAAVAGNDRSYQYTLVPRDEPTMLAYITAALAEQKAGRAVVWSIRSLTQNRLVGMARFQDLDYWPAPVSWPPGIAAPAEQRSTPATAEYGIWLARSAQLTGTATETALLMTGHAFDTWNAHRITTRTDARNIGVIRAMDRMKIHCEGIRRAHGRAMDGQVQNSIFYSTLRSEWPALRIRMLDHLSHWMMQHAEPNREGSGTDTKMSPSPVRRRTSFGHAPSSHPGDH